MARAKLPKAVAWALALEKAKMVPAFWTLPTKVETCTSVPLLAMVPMASVSKIAMPKALSRAITLPKAETWLDCALATMKPVFVTLPMKVSAKMPMPIAWAPAVPIPMPVAVAFAAIVPVLLTLPMNVSTLT